MNKFRGGCSNCASFEESAMCSLAKQVISDKVTENAISIVYKKGQDLFVEGSKFRGVFCIEKGSVKIYKECDERSLTLGFVGNSELLGFTGFFNNGTYIHSASCLEDSQICFIPEKAFRSLISVNPEFLLELLRRSSEENYRMSNFIRDLKCGNMLNRVARTLIEIADKFGVDHSNYFNLVLTRKEIAEISGTTTESAIRILNKLKKEGIVCTKKAQIKIVDLNKLKHYKRSQS